MLVLTRKSEQKIVIGNKQKVVITVLKVEGNQVSLGIEADKDTPILREEIIKEIEEANTLGAMAKDSVDVKSIAENLKLKKRRHGVAKSKV